MHAAMGGGRLIAGRYRLEGPIGRGAMGIVWHGRDELLARDVAIKEVQITAKAVPTEAEAIYQRTLREARAAASLSDPGAVTVFDVVEENGSPWIVMELVKGRSLDRVITEDGPLPPDKAAELGLSLLGALAAAHSAGVLHRDVKPSNVLIAGDGRAVLTDFGIATFAGDPGQTQHGMVVGTPGFTAPERVRGEAATPASDLWSLGATLYAAVEGRGPFARTGGATVITAAVAREDAPRAPSAGALGPVIDALLRSDPSARPDAASASRLLAEAAAVPAAPPADQHAFLDPPAFAELSMPEPADPTDDLRPVADRHALAAAVGAAAVAEVMVGAGASPPAVRRPAGSDDSGPVLWQPLKRTSVEAGPAGPATGELCEDAGRSGSGSGATSGSGGGGSGFLRGGQASSTPGRWRLPLVGAGIAVIAAAIVGWYLYRGPSTTQALQNPSAPSLTVPRGGSGPAIHGQRSSSAGVNHGGSTPAAGGTAPAATSNGQGAASGKPGTSPLGNPGGSASPSSPPSASPSSSPSASPSPSPSHTPTGPVLPPGYVWHRFTAAVMGTAAGLEIGTPSSWRQSITALSAHLNQVADSFQLTVNLAPWTLAGPLAEAEHLQQQVAKADPGYKDLALGAIGFRTVGGFTTAAAAELKFRWTKPTGSVTELVILVTLLTKSGPQPYEFTLSAPSATFGSASSIFSTAMPTFRPLPGA